MDKRRIVVKIGSSSLTNISGGLSNSKLKEHVSAIATLREQGYEVILISSGAVAAGFGDLGYPARPVTVAGKQAAAAVGQGLLVQAYTEAFRTYKVVTSQLLLTRDVFINEEQYSNVYATLSELLKRSVLPIINENDTVAIEELTFGDNDMLSALVSGLVNADFLILLTDINGLYDTNPKIDPNAKRYDYLSSISDELINQTNNNSGSKFGTGGMKSKIMAAQTALSLGVPIFVGSGTGLQKLVDIVNGKGDGTYIGDEHSHSLRKQKQWIAFHSPVKGQLVIDQGAEQAITNAGKSLLPAGLIDINGDFNVADVVEIVNIHGKILAKGQVNYSSNDLIKIKGKLSSDAMRETNRPRPEVIHRDRLVISLKEVIM